MKPVGVYASGLAGLLALSLLAACDLAPDFTRPETATPAAYKEEGKNPDASVAKPNAPQGPGFVGPGFVGPGLEGPGLEGRGSEGATAGEWKPAAPHDGEDRGPWWKIFDDPRLDGLEEQVTSANQNLKAAFARLQQARGQARVARADFFPTVTGNASYTREQASSTVANTEPHTQFNDFLLDADISYEIDVFGRVRNSFVAAKETARASAGDLAALDLSTHAELAADYFMLHGLDSQGAVLDQTVKDYEKALELTRNRYQGGVAAEVDVDQAETQLETAKTQAVDVHLKRAQLEHAIAVLVGLPPSEFSLPAVRLEVKPPAIDPGLPSALLERRPDIAAAERRVASANAEIGVARAAYFPVFNLDTLMGLETAIPSRWFQAPSRVWSLGPSSMLVLFDMGRREGLSDEARAVYDETVANYRTAVLDAYQDVEDELAAIRLLAEEGVTQGSALAAAGRTLKQANYRYTGGLATYLEVVSAQNSVLTAELATVDVLTRRVAATVLLVKALGGGWHDDTATADASINASESAKK
jgi:outer membrane protein, multidrug efflux system